MILSSLFFLILLLVVFALGVVSFVLRALFGGMPNMRKYGPKGYPQDNAKDNGRHARRKKEGEVSIDYVPPREQENRQAKVMKKAAEAAEDVDFEISEP